MDADVPEPSAMRDDGRGVPDVPSRPAWLRNARFDSALVLGVLALAFLSVAAIVHEPAWFRPILVIDLWILGYHHVVATFTRLCFDATSYAERRWMIWRLVPAVAAATVLLAWLAGIWAVVTVYFYWQWFHYVRQSWGISRAYRRADPEAGYEDGALDQAIFYAVPVFGILSRSSEGHGRFLGLEIWTLPVADPVADAAGLVAAVLVAVWVARRIRDLSRARLAVAHTLYVLTHFAIFWVAYVFVPDITLGWLAINIWHNCQYILFVWMFNNNRFKHGVDRNARFLSYISQSGRMWLYLLACITITGVVYWGAVRTIDWLFFAGLSATVVLYQIVNFHHYIVDALIWRTRRPSPSYAARQGSGR